MKTKCQVTLFYKTEGFQSLCTTVELYLDLDDSIKDQVFGIYGDKIDYFIWKELTPYKEVPTMTLFKMQFLEQDRDKQFTMKKELWTRGYYGQTDRNCPKHI
jgi:hypothetical protein